jgi:hypothetical protein
MLGVRVLLLLAAFVCAVASLATSRVHPAVAPLLLCVLELLRLFPL